MCPGNHESAGKRRSGKTTEGSPWLKRTLTQASWAAARTSNTYLAALYHRLAARRGKKRAVVAVGHTILTAAYHILRDGREYAALGASHFDNLNAARLTQHLVRRLQSLGHKVTLENAA
jgi:transposase